MSQAPSKASQGAVNSAGANKKKTGKDKRKKFMKAQKKTPMEKQKMTWGPPKDTQQFSSNWKNLLEVK